MVLSWAASRARTRPGRRAIVTRMISPAQSMFRLTFRRMARLTGRLIPQLTVTAAVLFFAASGLARARPSDPQAADASSAPTTPREKEELHARILMATKQY